MDFLQFIKSAFIFFFNVMVTSVIMVERNIFEKELWNLLWWMLIQSKVANQMGGKGENES